MAEGSVISDLHLFTNRSDAEYSAEAIRQAFAESDFFVLNGDIFDFRWSTFSTVEATLNAAEEWIRSLAAVNLSCQIHYVLGNHDSPARFAAHLEMLAEQIPNFSWHPSHVRIGRNLFLHGDLPISHRRFSPFHRVLGHVEKRKGKLMNLAYAALISSRLHRVIDRFHSPLRCAQHIHRAIMNDKTDLAEGLTDVYFGHVHYVMHDFAYRGLRFHNTGSTVRHLNSRIIRVTAD